MKTNYKYINYLIAAALISSSGNVSSVTLDTKIPASQSADFVTTIDVDLPSQPLTISLMQLAKTAGLSLAYDSTLVKGKTAPAVKGRMSVNEALNQLLFATGLGARIKGTTAVIEPASMYVEKGPRLNIPQVSIRAKRPIDISPIPGGLALNKEEIAGNVQTLSAEEIKNAHAVSIGDLMESQLQSVSVSDYSGNPFQMNVNYRGFTASPELGSPQGLSVFMDGIRVNEPFGDIVNWDLIPMNALAGLDVVPGSNPIFGLNTLGGAISVRTKNGFDNPESSAQVLTGAFGRTQGTLSYGGSRGDVGWYVSADRFDEDGWRDNSPTTVNQLFGKLSYRGDKLTADGTVIYANNTLVGNGLIPQEMYAQSHSAVFTAPDKTDDNLLQFQLSGAFQINDSLSITGMTYHRKSNRVSQSGDINRDFADSGAPATRRPTAGEQPVCAYASTNQYHIANYYIGEELFGPGAGTGISSVAGAGPVSGTPYTGINFGSNPVIVGGVSQDVEGDGIPDIDVTSFNAVLPTNPAVAGGTETAAMIAAGTQLNSGMFDGRYGPHGNFSLAQGFGFDHSDYFSPTNNANGNSAAQFAVSLLGGDFNGMNEESAVYFTTNDSGGTFDQANYLIFDDPLQVQAGGNCGPTSINPATGALVNGQIQVQVGGNSIPMNGAFSNNGNGTGYVDGTPTSVVSTIAINQMVRGSSMQFNFDNGRHKFMVGGSWDHADDTYTSSQMLGLLTADRTAYVSPSTISPSFTAGNTPIENNDFMGSSDTRSAYLSETFNPTDALHLNFSARYNYTQVSTTIAARPRSSSVDLMDYQSSFMDYLLCNGLTLADCNQALLTTQVSNVAGDRLDPAATEVAIYRKLNPAIGATWSVNDNLNVYASWNQGTRTPSAIELGCAFDHTPTMSGGGIVPASFAQGHHACELPNALSGDPALPQVIARTFETGVRGKLPNGWDWNASIYQTGLQDDIYFVGYTPNISFFDTVGSTLRKGIEMGFSGTEGKWDFKFNYSYVNATFQTTTQIANSSNSSVAHSDFLVDGSGNLILDAGGHPQNNDNRDLETINPGDHIPGIPAHNGNINIGYAWNNKLHFSLNMVAHGISFARGNENNQQQAGTITEQIADPLGTGHIFTIPATFIGDGKTAGYAVFNLNGTYDFGNGWLGTLTLNNVLDKSYASASRLDVNPFTPGGNGAHDASGFNYNSSEWANTTFIGPGAPRSLWVTLKYDFNADPR